MRKFNLALGILAATSSLSALWSWQQLHVERARATDLENKLVDLQGQIAQRPVPAVRSPAQKESVEAPTADSMHTATRPPTQDVLSTQELEVRQHIRSMQQREREMLRDPNYRKAQIEAGRRQYARTRADAIRVVGMTPEQADRVVELWVERSLRFTELGGGGLDRPSEAMQAEMKRAGEVEQAELRVLLGDEKYERWGRYLASSGERGEVGQLRLELSTSAEPLRDNQADAMVEAIYSERQRRSREYEEYVKSAGITDRNVVAPQDRQRWLDLEKEANQRIHDNVAGTLSAAQLARLDEMLAARLAPVEAALRAQLDGNFAKTR